MYIDSVLPTHCTNIKFIRKTKDINDNDEEEVNFYHKGNTDLFIFLISVSLADS